MHGRVFFFFNRNSLYFCFVLSCCDRIRIRILKVSHSTWLARCKSRILKRLPKFVQTLLTKPVSLSVHLQKRRRLRVLSDIKSNFVSYLCTEHHANEISVCLLVDLRCWYYDKIYHSGEVCCTKFMHYLKTLRFKFQMESLVFTPVLL